MYVNTADVQGLRIKNKYYRWEHIDWLNFKLVWIGLVFIVVTLVEGAASRLRPVLMTAITSAIGLIPMLMSNGVGAEIQRPLASVIVSGLVNN